MPIECGLIFLGGVVADYIAIYDGIGNNAKEILAAPSFGWF